MARPPSEAFWLRVGQTVWWGATPIGFLNSWSWQSHRVTSRLQATSPLPVRRLGGGGLRLLFVVMAVCGAAVALWAALAVPSVPPLPRKRQTVADLVRRLADRSFLAPTAALAAATAALSVPVSVPCPSPAPPVSAPSPPARPSPSSRRPPPSSSPRPDVPWTRDA